MNLNELETIEIFNHTGISHAGYTERNGGFRVDVLNTPINAAETAMLRRA
jgi:hypothetical protein